VGFLISGKITAPIRQMTAAMEILAGGKSHEPLHIRSEDEIGRMALAFNDVLTVQKKRNEFAASISAGDLTKDVTLASEDDLLGKALREMKDSLKSIICGVQDNARKVGESSDKISSFSNTLSEGASTQASSLKQISDSMELISSKTSNNSDVVVETHNLTEKAQRDAKTGTQKMQNMVEAMEGIKAASSQIQNIIKVIDSIAFQTNLLALNAAVEAARAGQHGRGFAVVAEEVRNLAARSAKAAQETSQMIQDSMSKVEKGTAIAKDTMGSFEQMAIQVNDIDSRVRTIVDASRAQADSIAKISDSLRQIESVTISSKTNAAEAYSASKELMNESAQLNRQLERFIL
ncbi:MAG: HAMP domain-containing protein, partial [Oligoflexales bacterium]|nr:HAMP domain-containing protein [Oligoflexales bacterium]